ncbi:Rieske domain-containing protein-like [Lineus longissimus]|uniref:Rieske domain-containing protein-like n=1 Tax=Lineus longissimus TaxID=88925 RepID=UPI002B4E805D
MANTGADVSFTWRRVAKETEVKKSKCQHVYAQSGEDDDIMTIYLNGKFHAMESKCGHMGGPLHEGDIENIGGNPHVVCPWHGYMFALRDGKSTLAPDLKQKVYETKVENGSLYIKFNCDLSTTPFVATPKN